MRQTTSTTDSATDSHPLTRRVLILSATLGALACASSEPTLPSSPVEAPTAPPPPPTTHWVQRTDAQLDRALDELCTTSSTQGKPILLEFSAPWCIDCRLLQSFDTDPDYHAERERWRILTIDVGHFDRHEALLEHFGVGSIAHWTALRPNHCPSPVTDWTVLASGTLEPETGSTGPRTPAEAIAWLVAARGSLRP